MNRDRPLDQIGSIKLKLGLLVVASIVAVAVVSAIGRRAGVPTLISVPVTLAVALAVTQWLARGMTAPLRAMTAAAGRMAAGDYSQRVEATSVDEVGRLAVSFNQMAADLGASDEQRRNLLATVSHELRTPLAAQRALLENIVDGVIQPDDKALGTALAQAERLSELVDDLLDLSRIDGGARTLDFEEVAVAELLDRCVAEAELSPRPVAHRVTVVPPDLRVRADVARLAQVVANLIDNADRHSPAHETVTLAARATAADTWTLDVTDHGPGIPPEKRDAVFERFKSAPSVHGGGTGLGLAISRWIAELHGGRLETIDPIDPVDPAAPTGACIRLTLPRQPVGSPLHRPLPVAGDSARHARRTRRAAPAVPTQPLLGETVVPPAGVDRSEAATPAAGRNSPLAASPAHGFGPSADAGSMEKPGSTVRAGLGAGFARSGDSGPMATRPSAVGDGPSAGFATDGARGAEGSDSPATARQATGFGARAPLTVRPKDGAPPAAADSVPGVGAAAALDAPFPSPPSGWGAPTTPKPFLDEVFGALWPERDARPRPGVLLGGMAIGAVAAATLPEHRIGLFFTLIVVACGLLALWVSPHRTRRWTAVSALVALGLVWVPTLRANEGMGFLAVVAAAGLTVTALTGAQRLVAMVSGAAAWGLAALRGLPLLGRTLTVVSRRSALWAVLRTVALSVVALVLFGALFASADAVFGSWAAQLVPDLRWDSFTLRTFVFLLVSGIVLTTAYLAINPPDINRLVLPEGRSVTRRWEWLVPMGLVIATFVGFIAAQAAAFFGGHAYVQRTTGLTYAEYVHQGFGQLTVVTLLTLGVMALVWRKAARRTPADRAWLRASVGALGSLTLLVVASALHRMSLYEQAYGFTVLRLNVVVFEAWLGLLVVLAMVASMRLGWRWMARAALLSGATLVLILAAMNPAAWVAERNIDRYRTTGRLDTAYLSRLGPDATPVIVRELPPQLASCIVRPSSRAVNPTDGRGLYGWNLGASRAQSAAAGLPPATPATCAELRR